MRAYKLVRQLKDGNLYPLFIDKKTPVEFGVWRKAECFPTKGFAVRKGWHCCFLPIAPHLSRQLANGEKRVWVECDVDDYVTYDRPESQGGTWILAQWIRVNRIISDEELDTMLKGEVA